MCTSPIYIKNRTCKYVEGFTRSHMYVPCGKCEDCRSRKSQDWFLRIFQEMEDNKEDKGITLFASLTYCNEHLPMFHYRFGDGDIVSFSCFCKDDVRKHIKKLKDFFRRRYSSLPEGDQIRYIFCSEYGDGEGTTHRPHYHPLYHIPGSLRELVRNDKSLWLGNEDITWKHILQVFWSHGMVRWAPGASCIVNSEFAGVYASKYITKDLSFWDKKELKDYLFDDKGRIIKERYEHIKDYLPNHWQTRSYGHNLEKKFQTVTDFIEGITLNLPGDVRSGEEHRYFMPQYIQKRMFYDGYCSTLNQTGRLYKAEKFRRKFVKSASKYLDFIHKEYIEKEIDSIDIQRSDILSKYDNITDLHKYITSILCNSVQKCLDIFFYNNVWSGFYTAHIDDINTFNSLNDESFVKASLDRYLDLQVVKSLSPRMCDKYDSAGIYKDADPRRDPFVYYYDTSPRFIGFKEFIKVVGEIQNIGRRKRHRRYLDDRKKRKQNKFKLKPCVL